MSFGELADHYCVVIDQMMQEIEEALNQCL